MPEPKLAPEGLFDHLLAQVWAPGLTTGYLSRNLREHDHLTGPLVVEVTSLEGLSDELPWSVHHLPVVLMDRSAAATTLLNTATTLLNTATAVMLDDDRIVPEAVVAPMVPLEDLTFTVPAHLIVPPGTPGLDAVAAIAADGAEAVAIDLEHLRDDDIGHAVAACVQAGVRFAVIGSLTGGDPATLLTMLCLVRAAVQGTPAQGLANILEATEAAVRGGATDPVAALLRDLSPREAAQLRQHLAWVAVTDVEATTATLESLALI